MTLARTVAAAAAALAACAAGPATAVAHQGNPNMESVITDVRPHVPGLSVEILNRDDRFKLTNRTGRDVVILGYGDEPYARVLADGTVQVNRRSEATYLNEDRYADVKLPASASPTAAPQWKTIDKTSSFDWHDHRMHYMGKGVPPQVKNRDSRTKVFNYQVPVRVGDQAGAIRGTLWWTPQDNGGMPAGAIAALIGVVTLGAASVLVARRRRGRTAGSEPTGTGQDAEAW